MRSLSDSLKCLFIVLKSATVKMFNPIWFSYQVSVYVTLNIYPFAGLLLIINVTALLIPRTILKIYLLNEMINENYLI